ncbi:VOC family protein [Acuticoccus sp. M5D2P5]|uniref:VOC family protein n=1 Tax=Acuticoccus kalidii TaxID=2910977 RepID=UPI001F3C3A35|nr:VOC family protein [Acuticoccus kalidii]MCF3933423.1 VOC family protein [Acuticoccus kalidii]
MQSISFVTLGSVDLDRSRHFYTAGFGWRPVFENSEIIFYQMNGSILGTFLKEALEEDMQRRDLQQRGAFSLAHNVMERALVVPLMDRLVAAGGTVLRPADEPPHGGFRGYVADPDEHAWEIAWTPGVEIDAAGNATFNL